MASDTRNMFGLAMTVAYVKSLPYSTYTARLVCEGMANGFGISESEGSKLYTYFKNEGHPEVVTSFDSQPYTTYENQVRSIINSALPNINEKYQIILTSVAHATIFGYVVVPSLSLLDFQNLLGNVLNQVCLKLLNTKPFGVNPAKRVIDTPFLQDAIIQPLLLNNYATTLKQLSQYGKTAEASITNYNWYDTSPVFHGPDLQIMQDVENQYYYVSGALRYNNVVGNIENCDEATVTISTWSGNATFTYISNIPCRRMNSYVGPVEFLTFNRIFNDGPPSSGQFSDNVLEFYVNNDKAVLDTGDYMTNRYTLFTISGGNIAGNALGATYIDANGRYSLTEGEYTFRPILDGCTPPNHRMHIGDNYPRYVCVNNEGDCTCILTTGITGWKFAGLEVPNATWASDLEFRQTNPLSDVSRIRKRAWSISDNPYSATAEGDILWPYIQDATPPFTKHWYVGYPQLNSSNELPQLAFYQTFLNRTFGENAKLVIHPAIATAASEDLEDKESIRVYDVGDVALFSGTSNGLPLSFSVDISSNFSGQDLATRKFFGMGNAFSGRYNIQFTEEENAGFLYTGAVVLENGLRINIASIADAYQDSIIGKYKIIKYISGYRNILEGGVVEMDNFYAMDATGRLFTYTYFHPSDEFKVKPDSWTQFAQAPTVYDNNASFERIYAEQTVESYFPRYYDGPFASEHRAVLYPNAAKADEMYGGRYKGIPRKIRFKVDIREEVVRELYAKYTIYPDGGITEEPQLVNVIRSDIMGERSENPKMSHIFVSNDTTAELDYNFNFYKIDTDDFQTEMAVGQFVDDNWAPQRSGYTPVGRNSHTYNDSRGLNNFTMGVKKLYAGRQEHKIFGSTGSYTFSYSNQPSYDGLFHAYDSVTLSGSITYVPPIFDLSTNSMVYSQGLQEAFPVVSSSSNLAYIRKQGTELYTTTGFDPLFCEYVGGRRGSPMASQEGGYHSKGIIGDRWCGMVYTTYGTANLACYPGNYVEIYRAARYPRNDNRVILFNTDISGTDLFLAGMKWTPYVTERNRTPFSGIVQVPYRTESGQGYITNWQSGDYINIDIAPFFLPKSRTGASLDGQWYSASGLVIGPFDRDIELGITNGQKIVAMSEFYIDGEQLSHYFQEPSECDKQWFLGIGRSRIIANQESYYNPRNDGYSILSVIPSGKTITLNVYSVINTGEWPVVPPTDHALTKVGLSGSRTVLSLRTHIPLDADDHDSYLYSGESSWLYSNSFIDNGMEKRVRIHHNGVENIGGRYEWSYSKTGKLYPKPLDTGFEKLAVRDIYDNMYYPTDVSPLSYWQKYAIQHNVAINFSGVREGSRISLTIRDVKVEYDVLPYQNYHVIVPSGTCTLSGQMGHYKQADNCVFTEGAYFTNATDNDEFADIYNPSYASDVLKRMTAGFWTFPTTQSGREHEPVLSAPSVMIQRANQDYISGNQRYVYLYRDAPYNYNKLWWPALSDLETLNPNETLESLPPSDVNTYTNDNILFSASQGQMLANGLKNPQILKQYYVHDIFQLYDSVATDALINSGKCITSGRGSMVFLSQSNLSGALVPRGTPLSFIAQGLV